MEKRHVWPDGHWNWPIGIAHKQGVRAGDELLFGIGLDYGDGERRVWYLDLKVLEVESRKWLEFRAAMDFETRVQPDPETAARLRAEAAGAVREALRDLRGAMVRSAQTGEQANA